MKTSPGSPEQVLAIGEALYTLYPEARYELDFTTPLELLVAALLAAQCTDERVNAVTKSLFRKYTGAADYVRGSQEELEQDIKPTGFYRNKAKTVRAVCQYLLDHHEGEVPASMEALVKLPGVGRKTANVVLSNAFGLSEGFIVDTHVARLARRFGWSTHEDINKIEQDFLRQVPREQWTGLAHRIIYHGRAVCAARKPNCGACVLVELCPSAAV